MSLSIRLARADDAAQVQAIYAPIVRDTFISFETDPPTVEEMRGRIERTMETFPWLVAERDGRILGYAYASPHRDRKAYQWSVDVTCYVHADARKQGVGRALYLALFKVLERQGFHAAFAGIALPNAASIGLHEAVGFRQVATYREVGYKAGAWRDTAWLQCTLGPAAADPGDPVPLRALGPGVLDHL